jgi:hypothetical protein
VLRKDYIEFVRKNAPRITGVHQMKKEKLADIYNELVTEQKQKQDDEKEEKRKIQEEEHRVKVEKYHIHHTSHRKVYLRDVYYAVKC